ncbi:MAG: hypothetical protein KJ970_00325 [Candidatus Eisenbacteria bacterium]|uniref:Uncharacterized protein n=1 Tax=Eiseniibacteriota bacterium TaxID=2212470 RepID=A0A948RQX4_UNCEI|nr:hypothetical protein [Candidatus Eisenbacteria bacterium]
MSGLYLCCLTIHDAKIVIDFEYRIIFVCTYCSFNQQGALDAILLPYPLQKPTPQAATISILPLVIPRRVALLVSA